MFDSGMSAAAVIADLQAEADVAIEIPNKRYVEWLNSLEQLLYSEIIHEERAMDIYDMSKELSLADLKPIYYSSEITLGRSDLYGREISADEADVCFRDLKSVYVGSTQLIRATINAVANGIPNVYYRISDRVMGLKWNQFGGIVAIIYYVRPILKTVNAADEVQSGNIMIPPEFIDLVKAKLRGEAYKLANEDVLAAKWLNDYNTLLEVFKTWVGSRQAQFGE